MSGTSLRKWYSIAEVAEMLGYGLTKTKFLVLSGRSARSRTAAIGGSCPNGSTTTSVALVEEQVRHEPQAQPRQRGGLDLPFRNGYRGYAG